MGPSSSPWGPLQGPAGPSLLGVHRAGQDPEPPPPGAPRGWGDALGPGLWAPRLGFGWLGFGWLACLLGFRLDSGLDFGLDFSFWLDLA